MKHLMTIYEAKHWRDGKVIWETRDRLNVLHKDGEEFILSCMFRSNAGFAVPSFYFIGLDSRGTLNASDIMSAISGEPVSNGYSRQPVSSASGFTIDLSTGAHRAVSNTVSFSASGGAWGPVTNVFLTDQIGSSGSLIASAALGSSRSLTSGDSFTLRFGLSLQDG